MGIRRRLAPLLDNDQKKIELAYNLLFSLPGSPFIYYGDEIGMGDDLSLPDRDGVRTPMQWNTSPNAGFSQQPNLSTPAITDLAYSPARVNVQKNINDKNSLWHQIQRLSHIRKEERVFQSNEIRLLDHEDKRILAFCRSDQAEEMLFVHNLSPAAVEFRSRIPLAGTSSLSDLIANNEFLVENSILDAVLQPYQSLYLKPKI